ncbi:MAG: hypothetical protein CMO55_24700 [Verrucomicrobiales bacterium]|nr:hypothetical protein [Verrucomicrobiales bacterium]
MIEKESHFPISRRALTIGVVGCLVGVLGTALAFVNEAISLAYEAATPYVEQGFEVREDSWSGEVEPGKPLLVRHQLFRGNEYWFWAGTSWPGASVKVDIFDSEGNSIGLESFAEGHNAGVRALPEKTGTYFIRVITDYDPEKSAEELEGVPPAVDGVGEFTGTVDWGLVYGYR